MDHQLAKLHTLAHAGDWARVLPLLRANPGWVNIGTDPKGYTALHQAAWHGANLAVIGQILALGADRSLLTASKRQLAVQIAMERHPGRDDLAYVLRAEPRTLAQLMRKLRADDPGLFSDYDGNQILFDRLIDAFGVDLWRWDVDEAVPRIAAALQAVVGEALPAGATVDFNVGDEFAFRCDPDFWTGRMAIRIAELLEVATALPIERSWAVVGDLFSPPPATWIGARGDLFLWLEMQQMLGHVPVPDDSTALARMLLASFLALVGYEVDARELIFVKRFARGGMSSGYVSAEAWRDVLFPLLGRRLEWLRQSWDWDFQ